MTTMRLLSFACSLLLSAVCLADPVLDSFYAENAGKTLRRLSTDILPENAFFMIHNPSLKPGAEESNVAAVEMLARKGTYNVITLTLRCRPELGDERIVKEVKRIAEAAHRHGIKVCMDLDPRIARREFLRRWPEDAQSVVNSGVVAATNGTATVTVTCRNRGDHMSVGSEGGYYPTSSSPLAVYRARFDAQGRIDMASVVKLTNGQYRVESAEPAKLTLSASSLENGESLVVFGEFRLNSCEVFSKNLIPFTRELMERYRRLGVDGAMRDEWGFPPPSDEGFCVGGSFWYSKGYAAAYARKTRRVLADDLIVMAFPAKTGDSLRSKLAGEYMNLNFLRNAEIEEDMYATSKKLWGEDCYVTKHPTWYGQLEYHNIWHDGIDWWRAKRDWAQSDETVPRCALLGMMRKFGGPNWMNEWYAGSPESYHTNIWRYAVAGARMVVHPLFGPNPWKKFPDDPVRANLYYHEPILTPDFIRAQGRIRLLNLMTRGQVVSQAAVVFGHRRVINFTDEKTWLSGESDLGIRLWRTIDWGGGLAADFWKAGYFADLFPSDEFSYGTFTVDADGYLRVGTQSYPVVVLTHLDAADVRGLQKILGKRALKSKVYVWDSPKVGCGETALSDNTAKEAVAYLDSIGAVRQPKAVGKRESWSKAWQGDIIPEGDGTTMLTDGTVARIKGGYPDLAGDDISGILDLGSAKIEYAAKGVFAARVDETGKLLGLAAGGATRVKGAGVDIALDEPEDFALYRRADGKLCGVWQTASRGRRIPEKLRGLADSWSVLQLPEDGPYPSSAYVQEFSAKPGDDLVALRDEIRAMRNPDYSPVQVILEDGVYEMDKVLELTEQDDNVVFRARNPKKAIFVGGLAFRGAEAKRLDPNCGTARRLQRDAVGHVLTLEIPEHVRSLFTNEVCRKVTYGEADGFDRSGRLRKEGQGTSHPMLAIDSHFMWPARWPNDGVFYTVEEDGFVCSANKTNDMNVIRLPSARAAEWKTECRPAFAYGFIFGVCPYACTSKRIVGRTSDGNLAIGKGWGPVKVGSRMWFMNILEELDAPGEWCYEPELGAILFIPPEGFDKDSLIALGIVRDNLFRITGSGIALEGLAFTGKIAMPAVGVEGGRGNRVRGCSFGGLDRYAVWIGGRGNSVSDCDFEEIVDCGVVLAGGSAKRNERGDNVVDNCLFRKCCLMREGWARGGVSVDGYGNTVSHCLIRDFTEQGLVYRGVGHLIEYNRVYNTASEFGDGSAVYCGGVDNYGHVFRYNDVGSAPGYVNGLYLDDMSSGNQVYGNIIRNFGYYGIFLGGGRDNVVTNNIITAGWGGIRLDNRGLNWPAYRDVSNVIARLDAKFGMKSGPLAKVYPGWAAYDPSDRFCLGYVNCIIGNNVMIDLAGYSTTVQIQMKKKKTVPPERYDFPGNLVARTKGLTGRYDMENPESVPTNQYSTAKLDFEQIGKARVVEGTADAPLDIGFKDVPPAVFSADDYMFAQQGWIDIPKLTEIRKSGKFRNIEYPKGDFNLKPDARLMKELPGFVPIPFGKIGLYKSEWRQMEDGE